MSYSNNSDTGPQTADNNTVVRGTVAIQTQGCKLNQADSEALASRFIQAGYRVVDPSGPADVYILNTCTVTHVADSKARQALRGADKRDPSSLVVATGCYAQRAPEELSDVIGVDLVIGNSRKDRILDMVLAARGDQPAPRATERDRTTPLVGPGTSIGRTRTMIKIQEGCNQVCAYCIVPKVRGRERSIPPDVLLGQIRQRISEGYKEVVLTGTQLGSYGFDLAGADLKYLVGLTLKETGIDRLRISSLQPQEITPDLLELWEDRRLCPHFHIPLQSGSDYILNRMRRRYTATQYAEAVERVRAKVPDVSITADVIVGFPGEDDRHHQESLSFAHKMGLAAMHVFPYSMRPGTSAAYMGPQVDGRTKSGRMEEMLALAKEQASFFRSRFIGTTRQVLWERSDIRRGKPVYLGLTDNYLKVHTEESAVVSNQITFARLVSEEGGSLLARGV